MYKVSIQKNLKNRSNTNYTVEDKTDMNMVQDEIRKLVRLIESNTASFGVDNEDDMLYLEDVYSSCYRYGISEYYKQFKENFLNVNQHLIEIKQSVASEKLKNVIRKLQNLLNHQNMTFIMYVLANEKTSDGVSRMQSFHELSLTCDEYVFLLLYQFLGSRHAGESEKINKLIGVNFIHNHGYG